MKSFLIYLFHWYLSYIIIIPAQRSKLTFSKSRLLAILSYKMVAKKKIIINVISRGGHFVYVTWTSTTQSDTFATLSFAKLLRLLACRLKHCSNGRDKENEEISMSGSRNDLLQSCWDRVTNRPMARKTFQIDQVGHFDLQRRPSKQLR